MPPPPVSEVLEARNEEIAVAGLEGDEEGTRVVREELKLLEIVYRALGPERGGRVPAIALTAFARSEDRTRALRAGFLVHVSKPVDPAELVATVASVVRRVDEQP